MHNKNILCCSQHSSSLLSGFSSRTSLLYQEGNWMWHNSMSRIQKGMNRSSLFHWAAGAVKNPLGLDWSTGNINSLQTNLFQHLKQALEVASALTGKRAHLQDLTMLTYRSECPSSAPAFAGFQEQFISRHWFEIPWGKRGGGHLAHKFQQWVRSACLPRKYQLLLIWWQACDMSSLEKVAFSTSDAHDPLQGNSHLEVLFYYINLNSLIQAQTQIFTQNESDGFFILPLQPVLRHPKTQSVASLKPFGLTAAEFLWFTFNHLCSLVWTQVLKGCWTSQMQQCPAASCPNNASDALPHPQLHRHRSWTETDCEDSKGCPHLSRHFNVTFLVCYWSPHI